MAIEKSMTKDVTKRFVAECERLIAVYGMTREEFCETVGMVSTSLPRMKQAPDGNYVSIESLCLMVQKYGVPLSFLFGVDPQPNTIQAAVATLIRTATNLSEIERTISENTFDKNSDKPEIKRRKRQLQNAER